MFHGYSYNIMIIPFLGPTARKGVLSRFGVVDKGNNKPQ